MKDMKPFSLTMCENSHVRHKYKLENGKWQWKTI